MMLITAFQSMVNAKVKSKGFGTVMWTVSKDDSNPHNLYVIIQVDLS